MHGFMKKLLGRSLGLGALVTTLCVAAPIPSGAATTISRDVSFQLTSVATFSKALLFPAGADEYNNIYVVSLKKFASGSSQLETFSIIKVTPSGSKTVVRTLVLPWTSTPDSFAVRGSYLYYSLTTTVNGHVGQALMSVDLNSTSDPQVYLTERRAGVGGSNTMVSAFKIDPSTGTTYFLTTNLGTFKLRTVPMTNPTTPGKPHAVGRLISAGAGSESPEGNLQISHHRIWMATRDAQSGTTGVINYPLPTQDGPITPTHSSISVADVQTTCGSDPCPTGAFTSAVGGAGGLIIYYGWNPDGSQETFTLHKNLSNGPDSTILTSASGAVVVGTPNGTLYVVESADIGGTEANPVITGSGEIFRVS